MIKIFTSEQARLLLMIPLSDQKPWTIDDLRKWVDQHVPLNAEDRAPYEDRPNEEIWFSAIDNALSPSRDTSLTTIGQARRLEKGVYQITSLGLSQIPDLIKYLRSINAKPVVDYFDRRPA